MRSVVLLVAFLFALSLSGTAWAQDPVEEMLEEGDPPEDLKPDPEPVPVPEPEEPPEDEKPPKDEPKEAPRPPKPEPPAEKPAPEPEPAKEAPPKPASKPPPKKVERRKAPTPVSSPATPFAPPADTVPASEATVVSTLFRAIGNREPGLLAAAGGFGALAVLVGAVTLTSVRRHRHAIGVDAASANLVGALAKAPNEPRPEPGPKEIAAAGEAVVRRARPESLAEGLEILSALGYGDAVLVSEGASEAVVEVRRCSSCLSATGDEACHFELGFMRGVFESAWGAPVRVSEVACGRGERPCAFRAVKGRP